MSVIAHHIIVPIDPITINQKEDLAKHRVLGPLPLKLKDLLTKFSTRIALTPV